jgi:hypothetical protein
MAEKYKDSPERLLQELNAANARNRELDKQVNAVEKERKTHQRSLAKAAKAAEAEKAAKEDLRVAEQRVEALEKELGAEKSARDSERRLVENAQALKRAFEAL